MSETPTLSIEAVRKLTRPRSETDVQAAILRLLANIPGVVAWRTNSRVVRMPGRGGRDRLVRFGFRGAPDIIACVKGQFVGIEVKSASGRQSISQTACQVALEAAGGVYLIARETETVIGMVTRLIGNRDGST